RERQVLDGGPTGDTTQHRGTEVRVASEATRTCHNGCRVSGAVVGRRSAVITNPTHATEQARRPVRIPVVVERATNTISGGQVDRTVTAGRRRKIGAVRGRSEADAACGTELARDTTKHQE